MCSLFYQASASQFPFLMPACCFTQAPKRQNSLGILSGLCFQKEKPCWIANVLLNSLDVRAELTESHCLCLKQIFIMWLKIVLCYSNLLLLKSLMCFYFFQTVDKKVSYKYWFKILASLPSFLIFSFSLKTNTCFHGCVCQGRRKV